MAITRRRFIAAGSAAAAGVALTSPLGAFQKVSTASAAKAPQKRSKGQGKGLKMYRLSVRGRRQSNIAKRHCANLRFKTKDAARRHPLPHPGIHAKIVPLDVSAIEFHRLFIARNSHVADLRELGGFKRNGR